ncbi:restriction endonuclease subunit S [Muribacter muris]|uniref:Restriction endonuclease subunit S n=1 Tax=Muribacter muris TaxID=67855 RepID=A0A4Y9K1I5_9PAST|nr:restriction endonuclease subunit S [Muribacter muris]MBF0784678.1 restriction endonuclease subunit S [Muribacter muris]MBF0828120.1 restriction endonuclease subunit S [Muribacter muris]TFV11951.1 restriction endonuclease subunit S [Muribacter muris]
MSKLTEIAELNPKRSLAKGTLAPFIEMAYLQTNARDLSKISIKKFNGGGSKFQNGDTLFARITPCLENGKTAKVSGIENDRVAHGSTEFIVISAKEPEYDEDYLYYLARLPEFRKYAEKRMEGTSGRQRVSWQSLAEFNYNFPPKEMRKLAGEILKVFDDKIQLNTQINQTLENIAQAIFKSCFIDFDPVRAKATALADGLTPAQAERAAMSVISGKNPAELDRLQADHPEQYQQLLALAQAFPSEFEEIEGFGDVPRGWGVKKIEDVIKKIPVGKKYSQKTTFSEGLVPVLDQGKSGIIGYHNDKAGVRASIENPVIVFANHTCYMRLISYDFSAIQNVFAFRGEETDIYWTYLATYGKQEFTEYKGHFPDFLIKEIVVPNVELTELFGQIVKESFSKIAMNDIENSFLTKIRDKLLPKLLNGEIKV